MSRLLGYLNMAATIGFAGAAETFLLFPFTCRRANDSFQ